MTTEETLGCLLVIALTIVIFVFIPFPFSLIVFILWITR